MPERGSRVVFLSYRDGDGQASSGNIHSVSITIDLGSCIILSMFSCFYVSVDNLRIMCIDIRS